MACKIARSHPLLPMGISQEQGVRKETKDNSGLETEHHGQSGSNFSIHDEMIGAELPATLVGCVDNRDAASQTIYSGSEYCN
jgi:hypothetical protein